MESTSNFPTYVISETQGDQKQSVLVLTKEEA